MSTVMENAHSYKLGNQSKSERVLQEYHLRLRKELNVPSLLPYLNQYHLITNNVYEELILQTITNTVKVDRLVAELPHAGNNFLDRFIKCLRESVEDEPGTCHGQIADDLEEELKHQTTPECMSSSVDHAGNTQTAMASLCPPQLAQLQIQAGLAQLQQQVQSLRAELLLQKLPHSSPVQSSLESSQPESPQILSQSSLPHNLKSRPTSHHRTRHQSSRLECYLANGRNKRHLVHDCHRNFEHSCSTNGSMESSSNLGIIVNTPSYVIGGDITTSPMPFETPSGDDMTPMDTSHQIHPGTESPHKSHDETDSLSPFPTPRNEEDFKSSPSRNQMYPRKKQLKVAEDIPKVFFLTAVGGCDSNTISLVGSCLLGAREYESILKQEEQEQGKRIVNRVFEEWKIKHKGNVDFFELQNVFKAIGCKELIDEMHVFLRRQTRLFSFD